MICSPTSGDWYYSYHETVGPGHHRNETRQGWAVPVSQLPARHRQSQWVGLTTIVMVRSTRQFPEIRALD